MRKIDLAKIHPEDCEGVIESESRVEKIPHEIKAKYMRLLLDASLNAKDLYPASPPILPDHDGTLDKVYYYVSRDDKHLLFFEYEGTQGMAYETKDDAIVIANLAGHPSLYTHEVSFQGEDGHDYWPLDFDAGDPESLFLGMLMAIHFYASLAY